MTSLGTHPVDEPDLLTLIADILTPLGARSAERFRAACWAEAQAHDGDVDPNKVRARLLNENGELDIEPRRYSGLWSAAAGRNGFLDKTKRPVQISGPGSRGNGNKDVRMRRWRDWATDEGTSHG